MITIHIHRDGGAYFEVGGGGGGAAAENERRRHELRVGRGVWGHPPP